MPHSSLRPSQRLAPRCGQYWSMTPTTPRVSRKASSSSPSTVIFFGSPSGSGSSSDSSTGIQNRRNNSPIPVPGPDSIRNLLSSARSMENPPDGLCFRQDWRGRGKTSTRKRCAGGLNRPLPLHRHPRARARVRPVVPHRAVLGAAVVPEGDGILGPAEAALEQRILGVLVEIGQHRIALV